MARVIHCIIVSIIISITLLNCSGESDSESASDEISRSNIDTLHVFADFESHDIAQPASIEILPDDQIAIVDFGQKTISLIERDGELITSFGREGRGPGEFERIESIYFTDDVLNVIDGSQNMISRFDLEGNFIESIPFESKAIMTEVTFINKNRYASATGGADDALISITNLIDDSTVTFGSPKAGSMEVVDLQASLSQLKNGEIPDLFKNLVKLRSNGDRLFAYLNAYSEWQSYDLSGNLISQKELKLPFNEEIFDKTVEQAKNSPGGLPAYNYVSDFQAFDQQVLILTNRVDSDSSQLLIKSDLDGNISDIITLPADVGYLSAFDFDESTNEVYLSSSQDGVVYRGSLHN